MGSVVMDVSNHQLPAFALSVAHAQISTCVKLVKPRICTPQTIRWSNSRLKEHAMVIITVMDILFTIFFAKLFVEVILKGFFSVDLMVSIMGPTMGGHTVLAGCHGELLVML